MQFIRNEQAVGRFACEGPPGSCGGVGAACWACGAARRGAADPSPSPFISPRSSINAINALTVHTGCGFRTSLPLLILLTMPRIPTFWFTRFICSLSHWPLSSGRHNRQVHDATYEICYKWRHSSFRSLSIGMMIAYVVTEKKPICMIELTSSTKKFPDFKIRV